VDAPPLRNHSSEVPFVPAPFPDDVRKFVESTTWTFAKTYAGTWPHEYVVRTSKNAAMILALARHIFEHGTDGRFYSQVRKYHHEGGKVYWSMDSTPKATDLTIRCDGARPTRRGSQPALFQRSERPRASRPPLPGTCTRRSGRIDRPVEPGRRL
jgi:hypothetical protein